METTSDIPVLSFPAILRNPGLSNRYAHLHGPTATGVPSKQQSGRTSFKKSHRDQNEGKRWIRRKDNSRFVGNPHIVTASKRDYTLQPPRTLSTFPEPLPSYLQRSVKLPTAPSLPTTDPASANAGRFSLSLKGMRRDLRRAGGRAEALVKDVESEMVQWLTLGGTVLSPDVLKPQAVETVGTPVGSTGTIFEVSRTPLQLVWRITDDAFARYVVHCCARYHEVVSFSKGVSESRLTYLLRPNVTRPDRRVPAGLETPPVTDIDYSSNPETDDNIDSDFISENDMESDAELDNRGLLSVIEESPAPTSAPLPSVKEDPWSHIGEEEGIAGGESDFDESESSSEFGSASIDVLQPRLQALSLETQPRNDLESESSLPSHKQPPTQQEIDADKTVTEITMQELSEALSPSPRRRDRVSQPVRSASSPSRSPARPRAARRRRGAKKRSATIGLQSGRTFYEYLFLS